MKVHSELGPGLLESTYQACMKFELEKSGLLVQSQIGLPVVYQSVQLDIGYRIDLLVERRIIIEIKSVDCLNEIHLAQTLTYLKLSENKLGLLINFNVKHLKSGIKRVVNNF